MDPRLNLIAQSFELRKLGRICNHKECEKPPGKRITISEINSTNNEKRELVVLNLCTRHFQSIRTFLAELDRLTPGDMVIRAEVRETGYVTY